MSTKKTIHGIDLAAPGGLAELFAYRRSMFGDATMMANEGGGEGTGGEGTGGEGAGSGSNAPSVNTEAGIQHDGPPAPKAADKADPKPVEWDGKIDSLPADAQRIIKDLRKEDGDERVAAKTLAAITKALNPDAKGNKPDPDQLVKDLTAQQSETRQARTELAIYRTAGKHGADPDALLDSRAFLAKIADIDPTKTADIDKAIKEAVTEYPKLKAAPAAGKSGTDLNGGPSETVKKTPPTLRDAAATHYGS